MADPIFEGTTLSFSGTSVSNLVSLEYDNSPPEVPNCGSSDATETVLIGTGTESLIAEVVGSPAIAGKAKGATVVSWTDGGTLGTFTHSTVTAIENGGGYNGQITKKITFRPSNA